MTSFNGTNLDSYGQVDQFGRYTGPSKRSQTARGMAPGVAGERLMVGPLMPYQFNLEIRVRGTDASTTGAKSVANGYIYAICDLIGVTGTLVDPTGNSIANATLLDVLRIGSDTLHYEGGNPVCTMLVSLVFECASPTTRDI